MRGILNAASLAGLIVTVVLLATWGLSFPVRWFFGLDSFHALVLSLGTVGIAALIANFVAFLRLAPNPHWVEDDEEEPEDEDEDVAEEEEALSVWFRLCPCKSGKPFNQCCGKRAYQRFGSALHGWREGKK